MYIAFAASLHSRPCTHCQLVENQVKIFNLAMMMILVVKVRHRRGDVRAVVVRIGETLNVLASRWWERSWQFQEFVEKDLQ